MRKFNLRLLLYYTLIPLMLAFTVSMLIPSYSDFYDEIKKPFEISPIVFGVVWTILYILMGVSAYLIDNSGEDNIKSSLTIYYVQLAINLIWPIMFFWLNKLLLSFGLIILLIVLVIIMIIKFYQIRKISAYLIVPYLVWLIFAAYLNFSVYILNK